MRDLARTGPVCLSDRQFPENLLFGLAKISRAALTIHELEWLEPWGKLAELQLKCSNRELVYVGNTNVTQST